MGLIHIAHGPMHPEEVQDSRGAYFEQLQSQIPNSMAFEF